ncbi:MAG: hypothetical protein IH591_14230 [Bacteroidales bacterium]|nr:hypothetical protein [Bacteroidales bacterium]
MRSSDVKLLLISFTLSLLSLQGISQSNLNQTNPDAILSGTEYSFTDPSWLRQQSRAFVGIDMSIIPSINLLDEYMTRSHVLFKIGYRTSVNVFSGAIGVEFTDEMFMPIMAEYKRYFSTEKWAPYAYAGAGFSWHLRGNMESHYSTSNYPEYDRGLIASAGVGYSVTTIMNEFYFSLGYAYRKYVESEYISWNEKEETDKSMSGVSITIGLTF